MQNYAENLHKNLRNFFGRAENYFAVCSFRPKPTKMAETENEILEEIEDKNRVYEIFFSDRQFSPTLLIHHKTVRTVAQPVLMCGNGGNQFSCDFSRLPRL
jgi:hypothetical protein